MDGKGGWPAPHQSPNSIPTISQSPYTIRSLLLHTLAWDWLRAAYPHRSSRAPSPGRGQPALVLTIPHSRLSGATFRQTNSIPDVPPRRARFFRRGAVFFSNAHTAAARDCARSHFCVDVPCLVLRTLPPPTRHTTSRSPAGRPRHRVLVTISQMGSEQCHAPAVTRGAGVRRALQAPLVNTSQERASALPS